MILISHRGNLNGPIPHLENQPEYIDKAIAAGYEVEVDINYLNDKFYLGHDMPDTEITIEWMEERKNKLWFHCKNLAAATQIGKDYKFFCHTLDSFVLTSTNHVWVHDLRLPLNDFCIIPLMSTIDIEKHKDFNVFAICTDYISFAKETLNDN